MSIAFLEGAEYEAATRQEETIAARQNTVDESAELLEQANETIESLNEQLRHKNDGMWSLLDSRNACIAQLVDEKKALREQVDELETQLAAVLATIERNL